MTREEIIRMAYDAGMTWEGGFTRVVECVTETELRRFANLIAAAERESCAKVCEDMWGKGYRDDGSDQWIGHDNAIKSCASAIRARK
jgi:hypothetical protein